MIATVGYLDGPYAALVCPCGGDIMVRHHGGDQIARCGDCRQLYDVGYDGGDPLPTWTINPCEPPDAREVEGDLRLHESR